MVGRCVSRDRDEANREDAMDRTKMVRTLSGVIVSLAVAGTIGRLGFEPVQGATSAGVAELTLRDPRPIGGGRLLLRASSAGLDPRQIGLFAEAVRATDEAFKGIVICPAGYAAEARAAAAGAIAPVELGYIPMISA